jgi:predicted DNA-binding protein with PD1-like motif
MKASERRLGRIFVIRLEDGDVIPEDVEWLRPSSTLHTPTLESLIEN